MHGVMWHACTNHYARSSYIFPNQINYDFNNLKIYSAVYVDDHSQDRGSMDHDL